MSERADRIAAAIRARLPADHVEVEDESHLHVGHPGAASGGGHFRALVVSERFVGASRVAAQRLVYGVLGEELRGEIHALSLKCITPAQWAERGRS
jgi:BolA protein